MSDRDNGEMLEEGTTDADCYCRDIEAYLCRKNDGHLVRIVGPSFERVCGWARRGIPLKVAFRGIDRYFIRYYAKGARRRPVRVDFCEADVLDVFDEWRRATGVALASGEAAEGASEEVERRKASLPAHVGRVIAVITALRAGPEAGAVFDRELEQAVRTLDVIAADSKGARGEARARLLTRLEEVDAALLEAARVRYSQSLEALQREADEELAPFAGRMPAEAFERARRAAADRLLRETARLPQVRLQA
jgi:hypothetical protein